MDSFFYYKTYKNNSLKICFFNNCIILYLIYSLLYYWDKTDKNYF